mmetsp:Transcript_2491/g.5679  ORF Transcript_2491/g.5679 Transcript_2491/m.5679 type:complete len:245 (+) Transcript_2491:1197-1931(+)
MRRRNADAKPSNDIRMLPQRPQELRFNACQLNGVRCDLFDEMKLLHCHTHQPGASVALGSFRIVARVGSLLAFLLLVNVGENLRCLSLCRPWDSLGKTAGGVFHGRLLREARLPDGARRPAADLAHQIEGGKVDDVARLEPREHPRGIPPLRDGAEVFPRAEQRIGEGARLVREHRAADARVAPELGILPQHEVDHEPVGYEEYRPGGEAGHSSRELLSDKGMLVVFPCPALPQITLRYGNEEK